MYSAKHRLLRSGPKRWLEENCATAAELVGGCDRVKGITPKESDWCLIHLPGSEMAWIETRLCGDFRGQTVNADSAFPHHEISPPTSRNRRRVPNHNDRKTFVLNMNKQEWDVWFAGIKSKMTDEDLNWLDGSVEVTLERFKKCRSHLVC